MIPNEKELIEFIKKGDMVNYSIIAKRYKINNATVSDLIDLLVHKKLVVVKQAGGNKFVEVR